MTGLALSLFCFTLQKVPLPLLGQRLQTTNDDGGDAVMVSFWAFQSSLERFAL